MSGDRQGWPEQRRRAIEAHAREQERRLADEHAQARRLVADFAVRAMAEGLPAGPLRSRAHGRRFTYRTGLRGWYLDAAGTLGVGVDGRCYLLAVPSSVRALVYGVRLEPHDVRLRVGEGARDGASVLLATLLEARLGTQRG